MSTIEKHDMTQGKILLPLVSFTIPLVLGNLFQLTYNAADSVIVGNMWESRHWQQLELPLLL